MAPLSTSLTERTPAAGIAWRERAGDGVTLALLHGIGSDAEGFDAIVPHLPQDWRLISWQMPGYGGSDPLAQDWPVAADYAARLADWLDAVGADRPVLLGHSLGTLVAAAFARACPGRAAGLVLASCALGHGAQPGGPLSPASAQRIEELQALGPDAFAARRAPRLVADAQANPDIVARVQRGMSRVRMPGYGQAARMLASGRLLDDLPHAGVKVAVITGAEDVITPPDASRRAHAAVQGALRGPLIELPGAGHAVYQQAPAAFAGALRDCLAAEPSMKGATR